MCDVKAILTTCTGGRRGMAGIASALVVTLLFLTHVPRAVAEQGAIETLRVALYPYVPDARELFFKLEAVFEATYPGVNLELVESYSDPKTGDVVPLSQTYYNGGLTQVEADIYEIDTVLLDEMVRKNKLAPIILPNRNFVPGSAAAVQLAGSTWGVPHWACGNFLFYEKGDSAIEQARTWEELAAVFGKTGGLLLDLKGTSTLGEWYMTALAAAEGDTTVLLQKLRTPDLSQEAVNKLSLFLQRCPVGYCRSEALHDQAGSYAKLFVHRKARAYIGYSETLHSALQEIADDCMPTDGCRFPEQIAVRALPTGTSQGRQIGWVDALSLSSRLSERKKQLALSFIEFATSWEGYRLVLNPEWPSAPRYLLPAVSWIDSEAKLQPPLYPELARAFGSRAIMTADGLNDLLRKHGKSLECALPPERGDQTWQRKCQKH